MAIIGAHALLYSSQPEALRAMLRDTFDLKHVDAGGGWLIFTLPPAELGVHPSEGSRQLPESHKLNFMCDDIQGTLLELRGKGVKVKGEPEDEGFGITAMLELPGGVEVMLYEPRHPVALDLRASALPPAIVTLLNEALNGPHGASGYFLNPGDRGLLASLDALSAEVASARPGGRSSVASHVDHLRYGLNRQNREARGETLEAANWADSWTRQQVNDEQWKALRAALATEARAWLEVMKQPPAWDETGYTDAISSIPHLTYHLGAIRQLAQAASGPQATPAS
jgi:hypothetical protein